MKSKDENERLKELVLDAYIKGYNYSGTENNANPSGMKWDDFQKLHSL